MKRFIKFAYELVPFNSRPIVAEIDHYMEVNYRASHRKYHNMDYINRCLKNFDLVQSLVYDNNKMELAIWCHKIIQVPGSAVHPYICADYAQQVALVLGRDRKYARSVAQMVYRGLLGYLELNEDNSLFIDIIRSDLGLEPDEYKSNLKKIEEEYALAHPTNFKYNRIQFLKRCLVVKTIYRTEYFKDLYEKNAQHNVNEELKEILKNGHPGDFLKDY